MIIPQPEADLSLNIMVLGADIIKSLKNRDDYIIAEDMMNLFLMKDNRRTPQLFFDTLTFLFMLGIVEETNYKVRLKYGPTQKHLF